MNPSIGGVRGVVGRCAYLVCGQAVQQQLSCGHLSGAQFVLQPLDLDAPQQAVLIPAHLRIEERQPSGALERRDETHTQAGGVSRAGSEE